MRILHVVAGLPPEGCGLAESVPQLALAEKQAGAEVRIVTTADAGATLSPAAETARAHHVQIKTCLRSVPRALYFSWEMIRVLKQEIAFADFVCIHGNWTFPVWYSAWLSLKHKKRLIFSPEGSFDPIRLAHSAWKKRAVGWIDRHFLSHADGIRATSKPEQTWMQNIAPGIPVQIIENGVSLPPEIHFPRKKSHTKRLLYFGRLHPLKGLDLLLEAFALVHDKMPDWRIQICGPDEQQTKSKLQVLTERLHMSDLITFSPPQYGEKKWVIYAQADAFILPTRSENFGIAVAEALACRLPVICTKGAPWEGLIQQQCGWWCEPTTESLAETLLALHACSETERQLMGERGKQWMETKYTWAGKGRQMLSWLKGLPS